MGTSPLDGWSLWRRAKDGRSLDDLRRALLEKDADRSAAQEEGDGHLSLNLRRHGKLGEARVRADQHAPMKLTVRELLALWGTDRRSYDLIQLVHSDLANYGLVAKPSIRDQGMEDRAKLVHTVEGHDQMSPAVGAPPSARTKVVTVRENSSLHGALTAMLLRDYSQLPVMSAKKNSVLRGVVTLKSLARALNQNPGAGLRDAVEACDPVEFHKELIDVLPEIREKGYVLVNGEDGRLSGIVTASDVVQRYSEAATPFLLVGVIDTLLRRVVAENFSMEVIRMFCGADEGREGLESADNLTMGDYKAVLQSPENWEHLGWALGRSLFIQQLGTIIRIRDTVMHFNPDPLPQDCITQLKSMVEVLRSYSDI
ncbi:CBS domain-containing protein [Nocardiopsis sp. FR6]|uniref:CBS domain-containing protein n=1 Tax=Nocardiopsis sp. FR6 TaxID=2605986 RepID=UPI0013584DC2|nr:CBS domain-containing protein [Nocardiopsis sp. FR6]